MHNDFDNRARDWDLVEHRVRRAETVAQEIRSCIPLDRNMAVMDFGCGTGLLGFQFIDDVRAVTFVDSSPEMIAQVRRKAGKGGQGNFDTVQYGMQPIVGTYDLIVNLMVFHHVEDYRTVFAELAGTLKDSSWFAFCDLDREDGSFHEPVRVPHNGFDRSEIRDLFVRSGLSVKYEGTVFNSRKTVAGVERDYPVFLMIGKRV